MTKKVSVFIREIFDLFVVLQEFGLTIMPKLWVCR